MGDQPEHAPLEGMELGGKNIPRPPAAHLAPGDAPCAINPDFTRKEAWEATERGRHPGRLPMTEEIAAAIAADVIQGTPAQAIALKHHYSPRYAAQLPKQPSVRKRVLEAMEKAGLNPDRVATKANELLDAKKTHFASHEGAITDERQVEDNSTQLGTLRTVLEAYGAIGQAPARSGGGTEAGPRLVIVNAEEAVFFGEPLPKAPDGEGSP